MRVAICEDTDRDAGVLLSMLERYRADRQLQMDVSVFSNGETFLNSFVPRETHIALLDVGLGGMDGFEVAKRLREADPDCAIIFTTVSAEYAVQSYAVRASHYLVKPVEYESFVDAMGRCEKQMDRFSKYIEVMENRISTRILLRDILYAEVYRKNCLIHTTSGSVSAYLTIDELEKLLNSDAFLRCHRSYIVNLNHVKAMHKDEFLFENGSRAFISRRLQPVVQKAYYDYTRMQTRVED